MACIAKGFNMNLSWTFTNIPDYITDPLTLGIAAIAVVALLYLFVKGRK